MEEIQSVTDSDEKSEFIFTDSDGNVIVPNGSKTMEIMHPGYKEHLKEKGFLILFVVIIRFIKTVSFSVCLDLFDDSVCIFQIIFSNESFNTGRIKDGHIRFGRISILADRFSNINKVIENELQVI